MHAAGFIAMVERVAGLQGEDAEPGTRATLTTLAERLSPAEARDLTEELPPELGPWLFTTDPQVLLDRVSERAGRDLDGARRATEAVLETLAERIADGEVDGLISRLPLPLHAALKRGMARSPGDRAEAQRFAGWLTGQVE